MRPWIVPLILGSSILALAVRAADAGKYDDDIKWARGRILSLKNDQINREESFRELRDYGRTDIRLVHDSYQQHIERWQQILKLYEAGQGDAAEKIKKTAESTDGDLDAWYARMQARNVEKEIAPDEEWYASVVRWVPDEVRPFADRWAQARIAAAGAFEALAKASRPGADADELRRLGEEAQRLKGESEIAQWTYEWNANRQRILDDRTLINGRVRGILDQLHQVDEQRISIKRQEVERDRQSRELEARRKQLEETLRQAYDQAKRDRDEARKRQEKH